MNELPKGVTVRQIQDAIRASGYPLQLDIASRLNGSWLVTEEWSYIDRTSGDLRALDISAYLPLHEEPLSAAHNVRPGLELLIECKRSELPYVFFKAATSPEIADYPQIHGIRSRDVDVNVVRATTQIPLSKLLRLSDEGFSRGPVPTCATFSKAVRKGGTFELSGSEAFNSVVMPLLSALDHSYRTSMHDHEHHFYFPVLTLAVCVVDAPMVLADVLAEGVTMSSWIRLVRHEATAARKGVLGRTGFYGIDVVHREFFDEYLTKHVLPFANVFKKRVEAKPFVLRGDAVEVPDLLSWSWTDISEARST